MRLRLPLILLCLLAFAACRKKDVQPSAAAAIPDFGQGTGRCRLHHVTQRKVVSNNQLGQTTELYLEYFGDGRIRSVTDVGTGLLLFTTGTSFTYSGDTIFAAHEGGVYGVDTVVLNARKQIFRTIGLRPEDGSVFQYDAAGLLVTIGFPAPFQYFKWEDGDVIEDSVSSGASQYQTFYTYYPDRLFQYANVDVLNIYGTWGMPMFKTKHLRKSLLTASGSEIETFTYGFDADGKVVADTSWQAGYIQACRTFEYECL